LKEKEKRKAPQKIYREGKKKKKIRRKAFIPFHKEWTPLTSV
jgi:hypothetical protein